MGNPDTVVWDDATAQAAAIRSGAVTAVSLVEAMLRRIERYDGRLRAYAAVDAERALDDAARADDRVARSGRETAPPFLGVALSVKDVVDVAGLATTHSCKALADNVAQRDSGIVRRLRDAGFVILGKTHVPEFCSSFTASEMFGVCRNPWDVALTPSGSSGGAAVSVAAAMCAAAHGTDGAGSIRTPASYCGVVGLKPSRGLIAFGPEHAVEYFGTSVDGPLARSVRDAAALLDAMVGTGPAWSPRPSESYASLASREPSSLQIAVCASYPIGEVDPEAARAAFDCAELLAREGHRVEAAAPDWPSILAEAAGPMQVPGPAGLVGVDRLHLVEPRNRPLIQAGAALTVVEHARWAARLLAAAALFRRFWERYDVLISPVSGLLPPPVEWSPWDETPEQHLARFANYANFAQPFNLSGQPAISLPLARSAKGIPIGVQLAGRPLEEGTLLQLAAQLERLRPWSGVRPPLA
jgi:amidase